MLRILLTGVSERSEILAAWRAAGSQVEFIPVDRVSSEIREDPDLVADCIVCFADDDSESEYAASSLTLSVGLAVARAIASLPGSVAMPDGRKWSALPFLIFLEGDSWEGVGTPLDQESLYVAPYHGPVDALQLVTMTVTEYRQRLLDELDNLGLIVTYEQGRYRVGHVLCERLGLEGRFYLESADRRAAAPGRLFTIDRDSYAVQRDVEVLEDLINDPETTEPALQKFFEEHPHFLPMQSLMRALPHVRLTDSSGNLLVPDFVIKPLVAVQRDRSWEVLDLKRPQAKLLTGPANHRAFSADVSKALAQVKDYGDYFQDPGNTDTVERLLGYRLRYPRLAVVIGRLPSGDELQALNREQHRNPDVTIVTYDEILERQRRAAAAWNSEF